MPKPVVTAWQKLEPNLFGPVYSEVWNRFSEQFNFRASINPQDWPGIVEPVPSITYSIAGAYNSSSNEIFYSHFQEANARILESLRKCTRKNEKMYALDWHHEAYWFYPHRSLETEETDKEKALISANIEYERRNVDSWIIPFFPDGDYYIFLSEDFRFGTFGHPWEQTLCVFGQQFIEEIERNKPTYFEEIRRKM